MLSKTPKYGSIKSSCRTSRTILSSDLFEVAFCATAVHAIIENKLTTATSSLNFILILLAIRLFGRRGCNLRSFSWSGGQWLTADLLEGCVISAMVVGASGRPIQGQRQCVTIGG